MSYLEKISKTTATSCQDAEFFQAMVYVYIYKLSTLIKLWLYIFDVEAKYLILTNERPFISDDRRDS